MGRSAIIRTSKPDKGKQACGRLLTEIFPADSEDLEILFNNSGLNDQCKKGDIMTGHRRVTSAPGLSLRFKNS